MPYAHYTPYRKLKWNKADFIGTDGQAVRCKRALVSSFDAMGLRHNIYLYRYPQNFALVREKVTPVKTKDRFTMVMKISHDAMNEEFYRQQIQLLMWKIWLNRPLVAPVR
jgi:hypothetical protein